MKQDILHALRGFRRTPGFTIAVLAVLALGIGANASIFSVVNAVLLRPLPFQDPSRLVNLWIRIPMFGSGRMSASPPDFADFRKQNHTCTEVAAYTKKDFNLSGNGPAERIRGTRASWTLFPLLGVPAQLGRVFTEAEDAPGPGNVAVLSHGLWQRRFGGARDVIGTTILLDSKPYSVIGVMPKDFGFPLVSSSRDAGASQLWVPSALTPEELGARGDNFDSNLIARRKPGVSLQQVAEDSDRIAQWIHATYYPPAVRKMFEMRGTASSFEEDTTASVRTSMWILLAAAGLVLLIGCANVANLLLARSAARRREMAIRAALGAGRARLIRQTLTESVLLAGLGGALGCVLAVWGCAALVSIAPGNVPRLQETRVDMVVLGFATCLSLLTGMLFGMVPAWSSAAADVNLALKEGGRGAGTRRSPLRAVLIVAEVALSLVLLVSAGLLLKSFVKVQSVDPGIDRERVLTFATALPLAKYPEGVDVLRFYGTTLAHLSALPGVKNAGGGTSLSLGTNFTIFFTPENQTSSQWGKTIAQNAVVAGDYFGALGIRLRSGRLLSPADHADAPGAVVINQTMANRYWRGENPIGQRLKWGSREGKAPWLNIVGVVSDVKNDGLDKETVPAIYMPEAQMADRGSTITRRIWFAVRTGGDPVALAASVRRELAAIDPELPVYELQTLSNVVDTSIGPRRFPMLLVGMFAALAVVLAAVGLYGVMSYTVSQHTQEIGVRMTLGASPGAVLSMMLRQGMQWAALGLTTGLAGAWIVTRWLESLLFGVETRDMWVFSSVSVLLLVVTLAACWVPARRATRVDPLIALRQE